MTVKHTPGPWHQFPSNNLCIEAKDGNVALCNLARANDSDATLIMAAPDLLASLIEVMDWIAGGLQASGEAWPDARCLEHTEKMSARARAAVDKAEGRS